MCVWRIYIALRTYTRNVHEVEFVGTILVSVIFSVYIPGVRCMMCCTWYVFVVALKVHKASSAQKKGRFLTIYIYYIRMLAMKNRGLQTTPMNAFSLVPRLICCLCM